MDLLSGLNEPQRMAVMHDEGPLLIFAGAGSGKTRTLTHRIAYLIQEKQVPTSRILAVTFTNKAAREMRERLENIIGAGAKRMWLGTFHALCAQMLRIHGDRIGLNPRFTIFDADDQLRLMKEIVKDAGLDTERFPPARALGKVSDAKNALKTPAMVASEATRPHEKVQASLYANYQNRLRLASALDFDDLLMEAVRLLKESPESLEHWSNRFLYVLIDEFQDVNEAQFQWARLLASKHRNICVVGDDDQCLAPGTLISTPHGEKPIENFVAGESVIGGCGRGETTAYRVEKVKSRSYSGPLLRVTTKGGRTLRLTPGHMCFARLGVRDDVFYVYLMFRRDKGFRVGITVGARSDGRAAYLQNGLRVRCNQEGADKMWVLRVCASRAEATYWESFFAFQYGLPTTIFFVAGRGGMQLTQGHVDALFEGIDTRVRAARLMEALNLSESHPHYRPNALGTRRVVHFTAFGGNRGGARSPWCLHRVWLNTSGQVLEAQMARGGFEPRSGARQTWRVEKMQSDFDGAAVLAEKLALAAGEEEVARWAALGTGAKFAWHPASHLRPSMIVPIVQDGIVIEDEIERVEEEIYEGLVYDLDVTSGRNYAANGMLVHNSIYAWRGANVKIILDFEKVYSDAQVVRLEQNYRSTQNILDAAHGVIHNNVGRAPKRLWSEAKGGEQLTLHGALNAQEEALWVVRQIEMLKRSQHLDWKDFAILCRVNAQSRPFEEAFLRTRSPLKLVGTQRFYERREIRDVLAYLKFLYNPDDNVSATRLINVPPRGIGAATVQKLQALAVQREVSLGAVLLDVETDKQLAPAVARKIAPLRRLLLQIFGDANVAGTLGDLVDKILERTQFLDYLAAERDNESVDRVANVEEFVRAAESFDMRLAEELNDVGETTEVWNADDPLRLGQFLSETALEGGTDKNAESDDAVTFMTLHAAKGLEFPVVFLVGVEQGLLPHARAVFGESADDAQLEEERRLMYVGLTRAEKQAFLTFAAQRTMHGRTEATSPSQFLDEIPPHLLKREGIASGGSRLVQQRSTSWGGGGNSWNRDRFNALPRPETPSPTPSFTSARRNENTEPPTFKVGDKVRHGSYGDGLVVAASPSGGAGEWVEVAFLNGAGKKKLIVAFANLERAT